MNLKNDFCICVPSKGRWDIISNFIIKNKIESYQIFISVEKSELAEYKNALKDFKNIIIVPVLDNCGVGSARNKLLFVCAKKKFSFCLFMDDNSFVDINTVHSFFLSIIKNDEAKLIGMWSSIYDLFFNLRDSENYKLYPVKFSSVVFFLKTSILDDGINFDKRFIVCEDNELYCRLRNKYGKSAVKTLKGVSYKKTRHQAGGCSLHKKRDVLEKFCNSINEQLGVKIITLPKDKSKNSYRFAWKKYEELLYENNSN